MYKKRFKSFEYKLFVLLAKHLINDRKKSIHIYSELTFDEKDWIEFLLVNKKEIFNKAQINFLKQDKNHINLYLPEIDQVFKEYTKDSNRFSYYLMGDKPIRTFNLLSAGYQYQYFNYRRWKYVQHTQIKILTLILIAIAFTTAISPFILSILKSCYPHIFS